MTAALLMTDLPLSQAHLDRARQLATVLAVGGYRRAYNDSGGEVGAPPEMSDALLLDIYREVGCAFRAVATERGEFIESGVINKIVLYFLGHYCLSEGLKRNPEAVPEYELLKDCLPKTLDGYDYYKEHLEYEIQKYRREGLRPDYSRKPLRLFQAPEDVKSS